MAHDSIITIRTFNNLAEASIIQNKLANEGIESFIENENVMGLNPSGGVELKVLAQDERSARLIVEE
ncbi:putative signal transducing protein [Cytophaga hutchinsonii]|jgi:hypothetical protein|nr:DUF2007 domain-containing protein [Cytophaga hutchinsonii]SFX03334.1 Putative signal transducing protein [Cytophaga hutchinsonii ATCC 33406]